MKNNFNDERRCEILGMPNPRYLGGCESFSGLSLDKLNLLIDEGYIDLDECQNSSPTTEEFREFMKKHKGIKAHGYFISPERSDCRVTIEGLEYYGRVSKKLKDEFMQEYRWADDCNVSSTSLYCWYD